MKIGIDIGGSHIGVALVNEDGEIVKKIEQDIIKKNNMAQYIINYLDSVIDQLKEIANIDYIGIGVPGNPKGTVVTKLDNLGIESIDFSEIGKKHNIKMHVINDGKAAALAEKKYGAMKEYNDCVFLGLGTGIGAAVFLDNKLLKAKRNSGFELAHIIIDKNGIPCTCGKRGCFEAYCSIKKFKNNALEILKNIYGDEFSIPTIELPNEIKKNIYNVKIKELIDMFIEDLIVGVSNIIDIFEPEVICFGGSFVYFKEILYDRFISEMKKRKYVYNKESLPEMVLAELKNDAGMIGSTID